MAAKIEYFVKTMILTPRELYQLDTKERGLAYDEAQLRAVDSLQQLYDDLLKPQEQVSAGGFGFFRRKPQVAPVKGVYLWGGVGRGKTFLIDSFFSCLPFKEKRRIHFQRFMKEVHEILRGLPKSPDPLPIVAKQLAGSMRILCLDEFHVDDVADAMLLAGLLQGLADQGVVLVFTSNIVPDDLYLNGLQRQRFLPAIELIKKTGHIIHLNSPTDYRVGLPAGTMNFFVPHNAEVDGVFKRLMLEKSSDEISWDSCVQINQRDVNVVGLGRKIVWLTFDEICGTAKSYYDYLVIAERYHTVIVSGIPEMKLGMDDVANRFIQLIDALYDQGNELIASAEVALPVLYGGKQLAFPFQRTKSRLEEMFSHQYGSKKKT